LSQDKNSATWKTTLIIQNYLHFREKEFNITSKKTILISTLLKKKPFARSLLKIHIWLGDSMELKVLAKEWSKTKMWKPNIPSLISKRWLLEKRSEASLKTKMDSKTSSLTMSILPILFAFKIIQARTSSIIIRKPSAKLLTSNSLKLSNSSRLCFGSTSSVSRSHSCYLFHWKVRILKHYS